MARFASLAFAASLALLVQQGEAVFAGENGGFQKLPFAQAQQVHALAGEWTLPVGIGASVNAAGSACEAVKAEAVRFCR